ncbi:mitotic checkpoint serine/threonine-protein kinase BUB1-like isoform X2 [Ptychodera flava]|uniref:mitotic checkpoint serine/threonine-protein kinase BUB1-like isoform X2 n=1 Tax=Ptychodera flava TaxID=63121 RepID=UPI00396A152B
MEGGNEQWELCKENVQPIRQGRKMTDLTAALQPVQSENQTNVAIQQHIQHFETEIRMYQGDDPFSVWYEYIKWTEQNFPKGGKDSNLPILLERCLTNFKGYQQYQNDPRYVDTWLKFINYCTDPLEIFQFLNNRGIGWKCAALYEAWATELENLGNAKKADAVYLDGIAKNAEPKEKLQRLHREFQCRIARQTVDEDEQDEAMSSHDQRTALGALRTIGKKVKKAPNVRVGANVHTKPKGLGPSSSLPLEHSNTAITVFDENASASSSDSVVPAATGEWNQLAPRNEARKENAQNPSKWNTHRVPQRRGYGVSEADYFNHPGFAIHEDEGAAVYSTPHKMPEMGNQVLSARKPEKPTNPLQHLSTTTVEGGQKFEVMYCKHLVYAGVREMSLEELRAVKYREKAAQKAIKEQQEMLRQQQEQLAQQQEQLVLQQKQFQEEQRRLMEESRRFFEQQKSQMEAERNRAVAEQRNTFETKAQMEPVHRQPEPVKRQLAIGQTVEPQINQRALFQQQGPYGVVRRSDPSHQLESPMDGVAYQSQQPMAVGRSFSIACDSDPSYQQSAPRVNIAEQSQGMSKPFGDMNPSHQLQQPVESMSVQPKEQERQFGITRDFDLSHKQRQPMDGVSFQPNELPRQQFARSAESNPPHHMSQPVDSNLPQTQEQQRRPFTIASDPAPAEKATSQIANSVTSRISLPLLDKSSEKEQDFTVTQKLTFEDTTTSSTGSLSGRIMAPQSNAYNIPTSTPSTTVQTVPKMPAQVKTPSGIFTDIIPSQKKTPIENIQNISSDNPTPMGTPGHPITLPSPTVHTKEALGVIEAMFNDPFRYDLDDSIRRGTVLAEKDAGFGSQFVSTGNSDKFQHASSSAFNVVSAPPSNTFQQAAFTIFDENASSKENQENRPPMGVKSSVSEERRPLTGVLQSSKGLAVRTLEDQENQVYADTKENKHNEENDMLEGIDMLNIHDKIDTTTYEMSHTSHHDNKEFQTAARMASTPFNPSACPPSPPCSTIRQQADDRNNRRVSLGESLHVTVGGVMSDITMDEGNNREGRNNMGNEDVKMSLGNRLSVESENGNVTAVQAQRIVKNGTEDSFEATINNPPPATPLSPILETSAEDAQSSKSSAGSSGIASHLSVHQQSNMTHPSMHHVEDVSMASPAATKSQASISHSLHPVEEVVEMSQPGHNSQCGVSSSTGFSHTPRSAALGSMEDIVMQSPQQDVENACRDRSMNVSSAQIPQTMVGATPQDKSLNFSLIHSENRNKALPTPSSVRRSLDSTANNHEVLHGKEDEPMTVEVTPWQQSLNQSAMQSFHNSRSPAAIEGPDPFDKGFIASILAKIPRSLESYPGYLGFDSPMPDIYPQLALDLDSDLIKVEKLIGKGAFAKIYRAEKLDANDFASLDCNDKIILKVQQPAWPWEFYMISEVHERLAQLNEPVDVQSAVVGIDRACIYPDGSMLTSKLHSSVTLLDLVNLYKGTAQDKVANSMPQPIILFYTIELLNIVDQLHKCGVIHGDLKPDNLIVRSIDSDININEPMTEVQGLLLIDFGQAIDMKMLPEGTTFASSSNTSGFMCHEMQQGKPWTYQTDYFGIAATVFCMMFGEYMRTHRQGDQWKISRKPYRWFNTQLWEEFFTTLLNVPNCQELPSLSALRDKLQAYLQTLRNTEFQMLKNRHDVMLFEGRSK